ncbi:MAG: formylglycine-generating enzyme family protein [Zoogloeaceae bacterium]|jgi:formylglycine-generating enzyme required for sulfatase activity|nr:formylglycine-generating enzyme family protein [Zoogloeaceae bacterium]
MLHWLNKIRDALHPSARMEPGARVFANSLGMKFVYIPAGDFQMGAEEKNRAADEHERPQHRVTISRPFALSQTLVTQAMWKTVMGELPEIPFKYPGDALPVHGVSYVDAQVFIERLNLREKTRRYRLPTETEWEYAARAGTTSRYWFGEDETFADRHECFAPQGRGDKATCPEERLAGKPCPVARKKPNPWGLYDMLGNVSEWGSDWYDRDYYRHSPAKDPRGPKSGIYRSVRGGSSGLPARFGYCARRGNRLPSARFDEGFRVASSSLRH